MYSFVDLNPFNRYTMKIILRYAMTTNIKDLIYQFKTRYSAHENSVVMEAEERPTDE